MCLSTAWGQPQRKESCVGVSNGHVPESGQRELDLCENVNEKVCPRGTERPAPGVGSEAGGSWLPAGCVFPGAPPSAGASYVRGPRSLRDKRGRPALLMLPSPELPPGAHTCFPARAPCPLANSLLPASLYLPNADDSFTLTVVLHLRRCHRLLQKKQKGQRSRELPPDMPKPRGSPPSEHGVGLCWPVAA